MNGLTVQQVSNSAVLVTPTLANEWLLKLNKRNRDINERHVSALVKEAQSGRWVFTPTPIVFSKSGMLLDGQHRLRMVKDSGLAQTFVVVVGVDDDVQDVIDTGRRRTAYQQLEIAGVVNSKKVASTLKVLTHMWFGVAGSEKTVTTHYLKEALSIWGI
jgi:hypothetical protein